MKKILYYLPIIILIIYMILFIFLQNKLVIIKEGISTAIVCGITVNVDGPINRTTFNHTTFQFLTFIVIIITLLIKIIMEILVLKKQIEITRKERKTNIIIYILLCSIITILTIYTTIIEPTAFLK